MKKIVDTVITLCALVCGVGLLMLYGSDLRYAPELLAALLNLLIFAVRIISMFTKKKEKAQKSEASESKLDQFIGRQWGWVEDWCEYMINRNNRSCYLTAAGVAGGIVIIGFLAGRTLDEVLKYYLTWGLILGEGFAVLMWAAQRSQSRPGRMIARMKKNIEREFPTQAAQEDLAEDMLNTGSEWVFEDKGKDTMVYGIVGSRYWIAFSGNNVAVTIVTPYYLKKIGTAVVSGSVRVNKVRTTYISYGVRFYYKNGNPKGCDKALSFESEDGLGFFMVLVRKRVGDSIEITAED